MEQKPAGNADPLIVAVLSAALPPHYLLAVFKAVEPSGNIAVKEHKPVKELVQNRIRINFRKFFRIEYLGHFQTG